MARNNKQFIINYHTSGATNPSTEDVKFGEIVVKHNVENPELLIKVKDGNTEKFVNFVDEDAIDTKISSQASDLSADIQALQSSANTLNNKFNEYYTSGETDTKIASAKTEAINTASGYTDTQVASAISVADEAIQAAQTTLQGNIDAVASDVQKLQSSANTLNSKFDQYYTSAQTDTKISTAKDEAIGAASAYTDTQKEAAIGAASAYTDQQVSSAFTAIETNRSNIQLVSGSVETLSGNVVTYVNNKISSAYFVKGSVNNYSDLPASDNTVGDVYNVVNSATVADKFYPAGTNWVYTENGWDALGGTIDLSVYETSQHASEQYSALQNAISSANTDIAALQSSAATLQTDLAKCYTSAQTVSAIATAKSEAINAASGASSAYTDAQISNYDTTTIAPINQRVQALEAISGATQSAVQNVVFSGATAEAQAVSASGAKVAKVGTEIKLDFSELIIDGGEF